MKSQLSYRIKKSPFEYLGSRCIKNERNYFDLIVSEKSLSELLGTKKISLLCWEFHSGFVNELIREFKTEKKSELENGRTIVYGCAECGAINCGAITMKIEKKDGQIIWKEFAEENLIDKSDFQSYKEIGPFVFNEEEYKKVFNELKYKLTETKPEKLPPQLYLFPNDNIGLLSEYLSFWIFKPEHTIKEIKELLPKPDYESEVRLEYHFDENNLIDIRYNTYSQKIIWFSVQAIYSEKEFESEEIGLTPDFELTKQELAKREILKGEGFDVIGASIESIKKRFANYNFQAGETYLEYQFNCEGADIEISFQFSDEESKDLKCDNITVSFVNNYQS